LGDAVRLRFLVGVGSTAPSTFLSFAQTMNHTLNAIISASHMPIPMAAVSH
jgi:hypothetical protein